MRVKFYLQGVTRYAINVTSQAKEDHNQPPTMSEDGNETPSSSVKTVSVRADLIEAARARYEGKGGFIAKQYLERLIAADLEEAGE